jgi:hypothetical protein
MKASAVYRKAAELIDADEHYGCCDSINYLVTGECCPSPDCREAQQFASHFLPEGISKSWAYWGDHWGDDRRECRVLALLLMAEISRDEE